MFGVFPEKESQNEGVVDGYVGAGVEERFAVTRPLLPLCDVLHNHAFIKLVFVAFHRRGREETRKMERRGGRGGGGQNVCDII